MSNRKVNLIEGLGEKVYVTTLSNGLEVHIMPKPHFAKKYAFFATQYGGIYNEYWFEGKRYTMPHGTAHFLEHQIFEDNEKSNFEKFEELGANLNAYTSFTSTVYHFDSIEHFDTGLKLLIDMVQKTDITEASVLKEIEVIDQEIRMYMDEPTWDLSTNLYRGLFHHHPIRNEIAGTTDSIREITKEKIMTCYDHFYSPSNMTLFIYGAVEVDSTFEWLEDYFDKFQVRHTEKPKLIIPEEPYPVNYRRLDSYKRIGKGMMLVGFKTDPKLFEENKEDKIAALKIANDLMFGRSSAFFLMAYEKGLVADGFDFDTQVGDGYAMSLVGNETDHIDVLYQLILEEIQKHKDHGFNEGDFMRMKRKILGRSISSFNSLQSIAGNYTQSVMRGNDLFKQMEAYKNLTLEAVNDAVKSFYDLDNHTLSAVHKQKSDTNEKPE